jgi:hypothetical protein
MEWESIDELHRRFPVHDYIFGVDWTDEFHPRFLVQDHIRSVCEGVFHVDGFCTVFSYRVFLYRDSWWKFFLKRSSPLNCASVCECECDANEQQHRRKREKKISIIKIAKASLLMYLRKKFLCFNCVVFFDNSCDHFPTHSKYFSVF